MKSIRKREKKGEREEERTINGDKNVCVSGERVRERERVKRKRVEGKERERERDLRRGKERKKLCIN